MDTKQLIDQYAAYDLWANTRAVDRLSRESEGTLDSHVKSSFPSLRATLLHIRDAEAAWHARLIGVPQKWPAEADNSIGTLIKHCTFMRDHVHALRLEDLEKSVTYKDLRGNDHSGLPIQMLMHCFNHASYHRGQVVTIMRQLDLADIPPFDLVVYQRLVMKGEV